MKRRKQRQKKGGKGKGKIRNNLQKGSQTSKTWHRPVIPALGRRTQDDYEFAARLGYIVSARPSRTLSLKSKEETKSDVEMREECCKHESIWKRELKCW